MRGNVVLTLDTGFVSRACSVHHAEEPVIGTIREHTPSPLFLAAARALNPVTNYPSGIVTARAGDNIIAHSPPLPIRESG